MRAFLLSPARRTFFALVFALVVLCPAALASPAPAQTAPTSSLTTDTLTTDTLTVRPLAVVRLGPARPAPVALDAERLDSLLAERAPVGIPPNPYGTARIPLPWVTDTPTPPSRSAADVASNRPADERRPHSASRRTAPDRKNPQHAVLSSLGGTVLLAPAFGAGLIAGPSFGHFYAGNDAQAWRGIGIRTGFVVGSVGPALLAGGYAGLGWFNITAPIAVAGILVSAVWDITTADEAAEAYNRQAFREPLRRSTGPSVVDASPRHGVELTLSIDL